jgi:hypothetical protein
VILEKRRLIGIGGLLAGAVAFALGVIVAHFTGLPKEDALGREILAWIPRGWPLVTLGQLIGLAGSQIMVGALVIGWIFDLPMTWARAAFASAVAWVELVIFFGIVPSEWLNLAQGPLGWTTKPAFTIPSWLVLNNEVSISYKTLKDFISAGYYTTAFIALIIGIYKAQDWYKKSYKAAPAPTVSVYGRPVLKGNGNRG